MEKRKGEEEDKAQVAAVFGLLAFNVTRTQVLMECPLGFGVKSMQLSLMSKLC